MQTNHDRRARYRREFATTARVLVWPSAVLSGIALLLARPPGGHAFFAWIGLVPLLQALTVERQRTAICAGLGVVTGLVVAIGSQLGVLGEAATDAVPVLDRFVAGIAAAAPCALFAVAAVPFLRLEGRLTALVGCAVLWVGVEFAVSACTPGTIEFVRLGESLSAEGSLAQNADLFGAPGLSLLLAAVNLAAHTLFTRPASRSRWLPAALLLGLTAILFVRGKTLETPAGPPGRDVPLEVGLVTFREDDVEIGVRMTRILLEERSRHPNGGPLLLLWPAIPADRLATLESGLRETDDTERSPMAEAPPVIVTLDDAAAPPQTAVAAGETIRFERSTLFELDVPSPGKGGPATSAPPGKGGPATSAPPGKGGERPATIRLGLLAADSKLDSAARELSAAGANALLISDGSGARSSGWRARSLAFRAIEHRRWIARCSANGESLVCTPLGRISTRIPARIEQASWAELRLRRDTTIYTSFGWLLGPICFGLSLTGAIALAIARRRRRS